MMTEHTNTNINYNYDYDDKNTVEEYNNRQLSLFDEVDDYTAESIIKQIIKWNREDKGIPIEQRKPIIFNIYSFGGSVPAGLAIIDFIQTSITPVYTVNVGVCYSMAFHIFIAGNKRFSFPNSSFLLHDGSTFSYDSTHKAIDRMEFEKGQTEKRIRELVIGSTNITLKLYEENSRKEWYFYADEAKKLGVTDYIIGADCDINTVINKYT